MYLVGQLRFLSRERQLLVYAHDFVSLPYNLLWWITSLIPRLLRRKLSLFSFPIPFSKLWRIGGKEGKRGLMRIRLTILTDWQFCCLFPLLVPSRVNRAYNWTCLPTSTVKYFGWLTEHSDDPTTTEKNKNHSVNAPPMSTVTYKTHPSFPLLPLFYPPLPSMSGGSPTIQSYLRSPRGRNWGLLEAAFSIHWGGKHHRSCRWALGS